MLLDIRRSSESDIPQPESYNNLISLGLLSSNSSAWSVLSRPQNVPPEGATRHQVAWVRCILRKALILPGLLQGLDWDCQERSTVLSYHHSLIPASCL